MSESTKAPTIRRRVMLGLYDRMADGIVLDVGSGPDTPEYDWPAAVKRHGGPTIHRVRWEAEHGDAVELPGIPAGSVDTVYASHVLEHLSDPGKALVRWLEVVRPGGQVFVAVPHRTLYEYGKPAPPSYWAAEAHLWFFAPESRETATTLGLAQLCREALEESARLGRPGAIDYLATCDWGYEGNPANPVHHPRGAHPVHHPRGEYQVEARLVRSR